MEGIIVMCRDIVRHRRTCASCERGEFVGRTPGRGPTVAGRTSTMARPENGARGNSCADLHDGIVIRPIRQARRIGRFRSRPALGLDHICSAASSASGARPRGTGLRGASRGPRDIELSMLLHLDLSKSRSAMEGRSTPADAANRRDLAAARNGHHLSDLLSTGTALMLSTTMVHLPRCFCQTRTKWPLRGFPSFVQVASP